MPGALTPQTFLRAGNLGAPGQSGFAITPNDGTDLPRPVRAIYVGVAGNIRLTDMDGNVLNFVAVANGFFRFGAVRVHSTGTTATGLIGVD